MIVVNTELLRQMKVEATVLKEFSAIAKKLSDSEEYSGLKHLVDTVEKHSLRLHQLFEQFDTEIKESLLASAEVKSTGVATLPLIEKKTSQPSKKATQPKNNSILKEKKGDTES